MQLTKRHKYLIGAIMSCLMIAVMVAGEPMTAGATQSDSMAVTEVLYESSARLQAEPPVYSTDILYMQTKADEEAMNSMQESIEIEEDMLDMPEEIVYDKTEYWLYNHGVNEGPSGRETYYNLPMGGVVKSMRNRGYDEEEYPYWVREDGVKMLGEYVIVAANLETRPKGTILETSVGLAMVCDTGEFVSTYPDGVDIAVDW